MYYIVLNLRWCEEFEGMRSKTWSTAHIDQRYHHWVGVVPQSNISRTDQQLLDTCLQHRAFYPSPSDLLKTPAFSTWEYHNWGTPKLPICVKGFSLVTCKSSILDSPTGNLDLARPPKAEAMPWKRWTCPRRRVDVARCGQMWPNHWVFCWVVFLDAFFFQLLLVCGDLNINCLCFHILGMS